MFRGWSGPARAEGTDMLENSRVFRHFCISLMGIPSVASPSQESEKHRLEPFGLHPNSEAIPEWERYFWHEVRIQEQNKAHKTLAHKTLSSRLGHRSSRPGTQTKKVYVPWVPKIAHKHLTPGLPVGRLPGHRRGHRPKSFMFMCLFL